MLYEFAKENVNYDGIEAQKCNLLHFFDLLTYACKTSRYVPNLLKEVGMQKKGFKTRKKYFESIQEAKKGIKSKSRIAILHNQ